MAGKRESASGRADEGDAEPAISEDRLALAKIVTAQIEELHITRAALAEKSKVSAATIREIEHPRKPRTFGRKVLESISEALEWPPDYLIRAAYRSSSETPDPVVQGMMKALAPYLEKINAIPGLQKDVAAIKVGLGMTADVIHKNR